MLQGQEVAIDSSANEQSPLTSNKHENADEDNHIEMVFKSKKLSQQDIDKITEESKTSEEVLEDAESHQTENTHRRRCCNVPNWMRPCFPPRGRFGFIMTRGVLCIVVWAASWSILGDDALPGGNVFSLIILLIVASLGGFVVSKIPFVTLPPLLGMLITGFLFRNLPGISLTKNIEKQWSTTLRNVALVIILLRSGLGLDINALKRLKCTVLRLAFCPCLVEAITVGIISHFLLGMPWLWAFMLGYVIFLECHNITLKIRPTKYISYSFFGLHIFVWCCKCFFNKFKQSSNRI